MSETEWTQLVKECRRRIITRCVREQKARMQEYALGPLASPREMLDLLIRFDKKQPEKSKSSMPSALKTIRDRLLVSRPEWAHGIPPWMLHT